MVKKLVIYLERKVHCFASSKVVLLLIARENWSGFSYFSKHSKHARFLLKIPTNTKKSQKSMQFNGSLNLFSMRVLKFSHCNEISRLLLQMNKKSYGIKFHEEKRKDRKLQKKNSFFWNLIFSRKMAFVSKRSKFDENADVSAKKSLSRFGFQAMPLNISFGAI